MKVRIEGQKVTLLPKDVIGTGGEATVTRWKDQAVKVYHQPEVARQIKLLDLVQQGWTQKLPDAAVAPLTLVYDERGADIVGFTMPLLAQGFEPLAQLANRHWRATHAVSTKQIAILFQKLYQTLADVHAAGMIVGDLNDQNELFNGLDIAFIDVDSWQFGAYPCMVATEAFCEPRLYGLDLSRQPNFTEQDDWYAFAVLAFKSLLGVHPYGGNHPKVKLLTRRAEQKLPVLAADVTYPKTGLHPNFLSDDLVQVFWQIFADGWRGTFPKQSLCDYGRDLIECTTCKAWYPASRKACPACTSVAIAFVLPSKQITGGVTCHDWIVTRGAIVWWHIVGNTIYAIANEEGFAVLYSYTKNLPVKRSELFRYRPGTRFAMFDDKYLVVCPDDGNPDLLIVELPGVKPLTRTTTALFGGKQAIFGASGRYLYRIAGTMLMQGEIRFGQLVERPMMAVSEGQTWCKVAPDKAEIFGYFRSFGHYQYFLTGQDGQRTVALPALEQAENLLDINIIFDHDAALIVRLTRKAGQDWLHLATIEKQGKLLAKEVRQNNGELDIHSLTYANGVLLYAASNGITREHLQQPSRQTTVLSDTAPFVTEGDQLQLFNNGLLVISENKVKFLQM